MLLNKKDKFATMCCVCDSQLDYGVSKRLTEEGYQVSHGYCSRHYAEAMAEINKRSIEKVITE